MAYIVPPTFTAGNILTAAQMTIVGDDILAGGPIYTTEALRDAAIPAPFEGQRAYITASTETTATGTTTAIPTGIQTIYNGAAWVTVTPVGAFSNVSGTTPSLIYVNALVGDLTPITVSLRTGTSALIHMNQLTQHLNVAAPSYLTFAVTGATTIAALDANAIVVQVPRASENMSMGRTYLFTSLTAGVNKFELNMKTNAATLTCSARSLTVQGVA